MPSHYDPLISKISTWGPNRATALRRMQRALSEYVVTGIKTNIVFHEKLLAHPEFIAGRYATNFIDRHKAELCSYTALTSDEELQLAVAIAAATARNERKEQPVDNAEGSNGSGGLSPWVQQHRASVLR